MRLQGIKVERAGGWYRLQGMADGFTVEDRHCRKTFFVEVRDGRWVGSCSCGSPAGIPFDDCCHQTVVRDFLTTRFMKPIYRKRYYPGWRR
jgi:hypothetical protein